LPFIYLFLAHETAEALRTETVQAFLGLMLCSPFLEMAWHSSGVMASRERERSSAPAIAGADEERCAAPSSTLIDPAGAADGFRSPKHGGKMSN
jgi:hypothetical protein